MNITSSTASLSSISGNQNEGALAVALMKKALDAQKSEGAAMLSLLNQGAVPPQAAQNYTPGKGAMVDIYA